MVTDIFAPDFSPEAVMVLLLKCKNRHDFLLLSSNVGRAVSTI